MILPLVTRDVGEPTAEEGTGHRREDGSEADEAVGRGDAALIDHFRNAAELGRPEERRLGAREPKDEQHHPDMAE
jgi:hypothetical protein